MVLLLLPSAFETAMCKGLHNQNRGWVVDLHVVSSLAFESSSIGVPLLIRRLRTLLLQVWCLVLTSDIITPDHRGLNNENRVLLRIANW